MSPAPPFSPAERAAVYRAIEERRDVRAQFLPTPLPAPVIARLLEAAHHAPSVGFCQPWDFVIIEDGSTRAAVHALFNQENLRAAARYSGTRGELYRTLKLEGILESPLNLCVTCNRTATPEPILGNHTVLDADLFSTCLAVQNLWLAARAEGIGVGWVSILDPTALAQLLTLPPSVYPLAYLCLGYVSAFQPAPDLAVAGWRARQPLAPRLHLDRWGQPAPAYASALSPVVPVPPR
jgi:5,6-dimethylbenzimidazole synthase